MNTLHVAPLARRPPRWALLLLVTTTSALAAQPNARLDPKQRYQRESAACTALRHVDDRNNCYSEASTRYAATQPSRADEHPDILKRNALRRCEPLPDADRKDCIARMQGQGTTSGSVAAGGIYRELITIEPAPVSSTPRTTP